MSPQHIQSILIILVFLFCTSLAVNFTVEDPDLPPFNGSRPTIRYAKTIPSCSFVIAMDNTHQAQGGSFNPRAYGLANSLLWYGIPVWWVIKENKKETQSDFSAFTRLAFPTTETTATFRSFKSGPFVVIVDFTIYAAPVIRRYNSAAGVTAVRVFSLTDTVPNAPVRYVLRTRPFVAVFDTTSDSGNVLVHVNQLLDAGFVQGEHFKVMPAAAANDLERAGRCVTMATEPHMHTLPDALTNYPFNASNPNHGTDGTFYANSIAMNARRFLESGGNFLAQCGGVASYEQCDDATGALSNDDTKPPVLYPTTGAYVNKNRTICPSAYFLSTKGIKHGGSNIKGPTTFENVAADTAFGQYDGAWTRRGGSIAYIALWNPAFDSVTGRNAFTAPLSKLNQTNRAHFVVKVVDPTRNFAADPVYEWHHAAHAKVRSFVGSAGGNIFFLTGHSYADSPSSAGLRLFMNAVMHPHKRASDCKVNVTLCDYSSGVEKCGVVEQKLEFTQEVFDPCQFFSCPKNIAVKRGVEQTVTCNLSAWQATPCGCNQNYDACDFLCKAANVARKAADCPEKYCVTSGVSTGSGTGPTTGTSTVGTGTGTAATSGGNGYVNMNNRNFTNDIPRVLFQGGSDKPISTGVIFTPVTQPGTTDVIDPLSPSQIISLAPQLLDLTTPIPLLDGAVTITGVTGDLSKGTLTFTTSPPVTELSPSQLDNLNQQLGSLISQSLYGVGSVDLTVFTGTMVKDGNVVQGVGEVLQTGPIISTSTGSSSDVVDITTALEVSQLQFQEWKFYKFIAGSNVEDFTVFIDFLMNNFGNIAVYFDTNPPNITLLPPPTYVCLFYVQGQGNQWKVSYSQFLNFTSECRDFVPGADNTLNGTTWYLSLQNLGNNAASLGFDVYLKPKPPKSTGGPNSISSGAEDVSVSMAVLMFLVAVLLVLFQ